MDTRDTAEQAELRRSARQLARELGPATVADLDDATRAKRLSAAVRDAGWLELRGDRGDGGPLAGGVEAAIVAEALGAAIADTAFAGPVLAGDLARRASVHVADGTVVAFAPSLVSPAVADGVTTTAPIHAVDGGGEVDGAYLLAPAGSDHRLVHVRIGAERDWSRSGSDLTRSVRIVAAGSPVATVPDQARWLTQEDLAQVRALGLALTSADLVGVMRGVLDVAVTYAVERKQYGVPIGSFQAVQHLLAEARCLLEGSYSVALHASWAVDNLPPDDARTR